MWKLFHPGQKPESGVFTGLIRGRGGALCQRTSAERLLPFWNGPPALFAASGRCANGEGGGGGLVAGKGCSGSVFSLIQCLEEPV